MLYSSLTPLASITQYQSLLERDFKVSEEHDIHLVIGGTLYPCSMPSSSIVEAKFTLAELGLTRHYLGENLDVCVRRLHEKDMDCCDPMEKEVLLNMCLHGMAEEYRIFLENQSFSPFPKLMEAKRGSNEQCVGLRGLIQAPA